MIDAERLSTLKSSLVDDAYDFMVAIRADFAVAFASEGIERMLGHDPQGLVERSVADYVHPDDLDRALLHMDGWQRTDSPGGTTTFRLLHATGEFRPFDVTAAAVTDGIERYLAVYCRPVDYQAATDEILQQLLNGGSSEDALRPVLDVFSWEANDSHVSIAWYEPGLGHLLVTTGLPRPLTGAEEEPGAAWSKARDEFVPVLDIEGDDLEPHLRELADEHGRGGYWVVPVADPGSDVPALVTVWTKPTTGRPDGHAYGMTMAIAYIELILRWRHQVAVLNEAARRDSLTEVGNRLALFDALAADTGGGALLYCDLDGFKAVNDEEGHLAGDLLLREVAQRIQATVGPHDLVARIGGDEFVILSPGAGEQQAEALADAIRAAVPRDELGVSISVGIACDPDELTEAVLNQADRQLLAAKGERRRRVGDRAR